MKTRWQTFKKRYWDNRKASERRTIALGTLALTPLLFYFLLWQPSHFAGTRLRAQLPEMRSQAAHLHTQAAEAEALRHLPHPAVLDAGALKTAVEESSMRHHMRDAITNLEAQQPNALRITLMTVSFEQWLNWLRSLQQEQHIRAESIGITALPQPGMVKISATLTNGAVP